VADRIVVMNEGRVEQIGAPDDVYEHPATPFVFQFLGDVNLFHGRVDQGRVTIGEADIHLPDQELGQSDQALFFVRPHEMEIRLNGHGAKGISALIRDIRRYGAMVRLELERADGGGFVEAVLSREEFKANDLHEGDEVVIQPKRIKVFPAAEPSRTAQMDYVI